MFSSRFPSQVDLASVVQDPPAADAWPGTGSSIAIALIFVVAVAIMVAVLAALATQRREEEELLELLSPKNWNGIDPVDEVLRRGRARRNAPPETQNPWSA